MRRKVDVSYIHLRLPALLRSLLDESLWNEAQGKVPHGHYKKYFARIVAEDLLWVRLDLAPYGFPPGYFIKGPKEMISSIQSFFEAKIR